MKHLILQKTLKCNGYQRRLASMVYKFFDKNTTSLAEKSASNTTKWIWINSDVGFENRELAKELHKHLKNEKYTHFLWTILGVLI